MGEETAAPADTGREVGGQAVALLQELIRIDTANPPGNEEQAQLLLAETLTAAGFDCELLAAEPGRPNLVARLGGESAGPTLCLLSHVDTVPADPSEWSFDPWAGDVVNGEIRGRGAQDMKDQVAAEVAAAAALGRDGWRPREGELLVVVTADEETGAAAGAQWLCREHPDKVRSDYVLNEGGGVSFELDGRRFYPLCVGEKGPCRFLMRARGVAGHASVPGLGDNALLKLAPALERLREQPPLEPTPEGMAFVAALNGQEIDPHDGEALEAALERLRAGGPRGRRVPGRADAEGDAGANRGQRLTEGERDPLARRGLGRLPRATGNGPRRGARARPWRCWARRPAGWSSSSRTPWLGNRSSADSPLATAIEEWLAEADPGAALVPIVMAGFSDSHWFRRAFDSAVVYGFCPQREMALPEAVPLVHGADERAAVADVDLAARFYSDIVQAVLG